MTSKRKPMGREMGCLYRALLKEHGKVLSLHKKIGFYEEYQDLRDRVNNSKEAPWDLKQLLPLKMPKYLSWVKKYLIRGDNETV